jgi:diguanylate cyclase (GGDEF)-like protein/PAS domain S-box-containing protein
MRTLILVRQAADRMGISQEDIWKHAIDRASLGLWDWNLLTDECFYSASWFEMLGYEPSDLPLTGDLWLQLTHPDDREQAVQSGERHLSGEISSIETELRLLHKDGHWVWVLDRGGIIERDEAGRPTRAIGVQTDITQLKNAEAEVEQINSRFRLALEASNTGVWQFDIREGQSYWDHRTQAIYGLPQGPEEMPRQTWHNHLHPDDKVRAEAAHAAPLNPEETAKVRYRIVRADGAVRHVESLHRFLPMSGAAGRFIGTFRDVTEEWEREQELASAARRDGLTGLLNRAAFEVELRNALTEADQHPFALFYIDLDYFKALNDSAGHAAGDAALRSVAHNICAALPNAKVSRLGGDEFAVLLELPYAEPEQAAATILQAIQAVRTRDGGNGPELGASIGIELVTTSQTSVADILARADDACYAAKTSGRNKWSRFTKERSSASGLTAARLVADFSAAKEQGRLLLFGQEIRALVAPYNSSGNIEVLARLVSPEGQFVPPCEFIPAAERFGMAAALDRWLIKTALHRFGSALGASSKNRLSFNLSAHTLSDPSLWDFIEQAASEGMAAASSLGFEITETAAFTNVEAAERFVRQARSQGAHISLDDFGAGLSSFFYLRRFPVDSIKIDGSFIENIETSAFDRQVVSSIADIANTLGSSVVAERIERPATLKILQELGIGQGQGFLMHRPEPLEQLLLGATVQSKVC